MILNGISLLEAAPIRDMVPEKRREHGVSYGLAEAGYDIRIKQSIDFRVFETMPPRVIVDGVHVGQRFCLASAIEEFDMPPYLVGIVHDKSTWVRRGLSVFNTVLEPGWKGFVTLELVYHGTEPLFIPAGAGIAQVLFHEVASPAHYEGKYQGQEDRPVEARHG
jgi:dCTP deaminase